MFKIKFSPQHSSAKLTIAKSNNVLTINGISYDFTPLNDGDEIPPEAIDSDVIVGGIEKVDGIVNLTIIMPYSDAAAPDHIRFPEPLMLIKDTEIVFNEKVRTDD